MNRNVESHFSQLPHADINRSIFDRSSTHKTSFNVGELIPFFWDEVLPGDTFNVSTSVVCRLQTLLRPIMDNVYMDTYYFFVPNRLVWSHWKEFMGENTDSAWIPESTYTIPKISSPENGWDVGTIADYLGIPVGVEFSEDTGMMPMALPFRALALICQEWFRDQNLSDPLNIPLGDSNQEGSNGTDYINDVANGGKPFKVAKYHDYFTSCLPSPQKGPAVNFSFDADINLNIPAPLRVASVNINNGYKYGDNIKYSGENLLGNIVNPIVYNSGENYYAWRDQNLMQNAKMSETWFPGNPETTPATNPDWAPASADTTMFIPQNLIVDTSPNEWSGTVDNLGFTINQLRLAFQLQKFYEKNARGGSRYRELLKSHFGVNSPDARMMVPEYLGGHRFPLSISQVENTAQTDTDYLGDVGAMSNSADVHNDFIKSFTEHGFVFGVCCVRYDHSYPQGLGREWMRETNLDYYWPVFANIGEQPVYKYEINAEAYADPESESEDPDYTVRKRVFGYQEAWASYRYKPSRVSGEMRPGIVNSLASWHLSDFYDAPVSLSDEWIREDQSTVDRVLAVGHEVSNQIFCDFYIKNRCTRAMPMYSIPGLIDHH